MEKCPKSLLQKGFFGYFSGNGYMESPYLRLYLDRSIAYRHGNNNSFDNLLPHRTNTDELQTILDDRENQHTADNTADGANTAVQRYTADYTGCDGICLIAVAIVVGCASCPGGFQHAANPYMKEARIKISIIVLNTLIPDTTAASRLPPIA